MEEYTGLEIAVIGMAGRFPKAKNIRQFWENLKNGEDCISEFSYEEALEEGESEESLDDPAYVRANAFLEDKEFFDSNFFNYRPDEAELMDPQVRIFHECCWKALEDSGYSSSNPRQNISLFAAGAPNINWGMYSLFKNQEGLVDEYSASNLREITFMSTRVSYKLNLRGPAVFINSACSSSLIAIHQACASLLMGECEMALAGGVRVNNYSRKGYTYEENMILSKDGKCRPFDADSSGTVGGEGAGIVVLKRLQDAIEDGDNIYAIIKGSSMNNDGSDKVGYTAPSVEGQASLISRAQQMAGVEPQSIQYVEAHGTATELGDPIEIEALNEAFGHQTEKHCAIGSVKSNIGHLDTAAGVAGFIKTVLAIRNRKIPASLHFTSPNPRINFEDGPFYVNNELQDWPTTEGPIRAAVSSFGIGGTNAHVILEEAPPMPPSVEAKREDQLIVWSAKSAESLERSSEELLYFIEQQPDLSLADMAYTLQQGRVRFDHRRFFSCRNREEALEILSGQKYNTFEANGFREELQQIVFMFSGQGAQYPDMCRNLYKSESVFQETMDECFRIAAGFSTEDFKAILFPQSEESPSIKNTQYAQPLLFMVEYSMAKLLMSWGIQPNYMIGHSIGEYTAACVSGVFSLQDAIRLVIERGALMGKVPKGGMLSIPMEQPKVEQLLSDFSGIDLAVVNSPTSVVVAGANEDIDRLAANLLKEGISAKRLHTSHAFHSGMMDVVLESFEEVLSKVKINEPDIPYVSNTSGDFVTYEEIKKASYWSNHLRSTVLFAKGVERLLSNGEMLFVEVGPGRSLSNYVAEHPAKKQMHKLVNLIRHPRQKVDDGKYLNEKLGELWSFGANIDWGAYLGEEPGRRISLPTYSFDKRPYTTIINAVDLITKELQQRPGHTSDTHDFVHVPDWRRSLSPNSTSQQEGSTQQFVLIAGKESYSGKLAQRLIEAGHEVVIGKGGESFRQKGKNTFEFRLDNPQTFWEHLNRNQITPDHIVYCADLSEEITKVTYENIDEKFETGYLGLASMAKALSNVFPAEKLSLTVVDNHLAKVAVNDFVDPVKAAIHGPVRVMPLELPGLSCKLVDIPYPFESTSEQATYLALSFDEIHYQTDDPFVSYRYGQRWTPFFEQSTENEQLHSGVEIKENGTYIIVGGLGAMGRTIAKDLVENHRANVVLVHRSAIPDRTNWEQFLLDEKNDTVTQEKIRSIQEMEKAGGQAALYQLDVTSEEQVHTFSQKIKDRFPKIDGLIWAAGLVDYGGIIQQRDREAFLSYTASKVNGVLLFEKYFDLGTYDFVALFSSIGNDFYHEKFGQVAYNAANAFMESYPHFARQNRDTHFFSINWCDWLNIGMTVNSIRQQQEQQNDIRTINSKIAYGISPREGVRAFYKCLYSKAAGATIFKGDLNAAIRSHKLAFAESMTLLTDQPSTNIEEVDEQSLESRLVGLFSDFFGADNLHANSNFFELGGDSLKGMTLLARINQQFGGKLTLTDIYEYPTIGQIADNLLNRSLIGKVKKDAVSENVLHKITI